MTENRRPNSIAYSEHFDIANASEYGSTAAGTDYYFVYENVLFLVLNSNNSSAAEHQAFLKQAIAEAEAEYDIDWKVVTFHHSVYSVASHATEDSILSLRNSLVPIFTELDIDVVLMGHDHVYCRTYMMDGLEVMDDASIYDGESYDGTIPATGHTCDEGVETVEATRYTQGEVVYTCTVCGETKTEYTSKVNATFLFDDVLTVTGANGWYYEAVYWAYDLGVTDGTSATTFSPAQGCTRAQFVTFLYRLAQANGVDVSSTGEENPFSDVSEATHEDYYDAILWAVAEEQGITNGTSATQFSPDDVCDRAMMVTFLYRYAAVQD